MKGQPMKGIGIIVSKIFLVLQSIVRKLGFKLQLIRISRGSGDNSSQDECYEIISPLSSYAPWLTDRPFKEVFGIIENFSLVDEYRCYELWQLVAESKKSHGALLEVGVWRGGTGALIAKKAEMEGIREMVYLCDTFKGVVKAGENDSKYSGGEHADTSKTKVEELIFRKLHLSNVTILEGVFPEETREKIAADQFRFCHIDVDVYQSAKDIFEWVWPRMSMNGIIVFDDYGSSGCDGITKFVNEERGKNDRMIFHNLNGHAVIIKISTF
jgi:O-methyltransferase